MPLMALVDYRGYRLVAMSVLPVNKSTLIYGFVFSFFFFGKISKSNFSPFPQNRTNDAGKTIHKSNKEFNGIMRDTAKTLNLKSHLCGCVKSKTKKLSSAADIEGHLGTDGKVGFLSFDFFVFYFSNSISCIPPPSFLSLNFLCVLEKIVLFVGLQPNHAPRDPYPKTSQWTFVQINEARVC